MKWTLVEPLFDRIQAVPMDIEPPAEEAVKKFVAKEILRGMAHDILQDVERGDPDPQAVVSRLRKMTSDLMYKEGGSLDYEDGPTEYWDRLVAGRIPTGLGDLDQEIWGGLGPGELGVLVAPLSGGKTAALVNLGAVAALAGKAVFHVSLEVQRLQVLLRYDMRIAGATVDELRSVQGLGGVARARVAAAGGRITIHDASHERFTPGMLEAILEAQDRKPDLLIVDYADLMRGDGKYTGDSGGRFELRDIYRELRRIAASLGIPVWTASQANREAGRTGDFSIFDVSEDISKAMTADVGVCLIQSRDMKERGDMVLWLSKTRMSSRNPKIKIKVNYNRMSFYNEEEEDHE